MARKSGAKAQSTLVLTIGGKAHDLSGAFPLTIGDWEDLETAGVVMDDQTVKMGAKGIIEVLTLLAAKANTGLIRDDIRTIPMADLVNMTDALKAAMQIDDIDRPT